MNRYLCTLILLITTSGAFASVARTNFSNGDFENGRGRWDLIEGARIVNVPHHASATNGRNYLRLSVNDKKPAKVQLEFKIKRPFERIVIKLDMLLGEGTEFSPDQKPPIHVGIRQGSPLGAFLGHRYLHARDLKPGQWVTIEKEIKWEQILPGFKKSKDEIAVFEIELMLGRGEVLVDNINVICE